MESEAVQNRCAAVCRDEAAIASHCTVSQQGHRPYEMDIRCGANSYKAASPKTCLLNDSTP
jgi:hypothetical protein